MKQGMTPLRQQYLKIKKKYPQAVVFFRLGDFYETFDSDARTASKELDIVLTSREMGKGSRVPMAGVPHHALNDYLAKLIKRGYKVAICEQMTSPGETDGLVEREVVRLVTPGTLVEPNLLDGRANNYLVSLVKTDEQAGIAYVDITTSEFATTQLPAERLATELERLKPAEIITAKDSTPMNLAATVPVTHLENHWFQLDTTAKTLLDHFGTSTLEGYGCARLPLATQAAGAILHYLQQTQKAVLGQISRLSTYATDSFMALDATTQSNLELFRSSSTGTVSNSLLSVIDLTLTAMGGRLLKRWLGQPLLDIKELQRRQAAIRWFHDNTIARRQTSSLLGKIADLERLINRIRGQIALPRELVSLRHGLETIPKLIETVEVDRDKSWLIKGLAPHPDVAGLIAEAIEEQPSSSLGEGGVIRKGFNEELDSLRLAARNAKQYLADLERQEREKTGIKSLKVGYNKVFGYYIEVSQSNLSQVPESYIRKQTLVGGERFFTPELKEYE
ncbi:MAG: DNA mismatch repair protein MutS, partial [Dehalococcoidales bacterium]|nr:DNA mismatch repair protein MutS [Dehalococcoidales bacterium]